MTKSSITIYLLMLLLSSSGPRPAQAPAPVSKRVKTKIFVHLMPWFETKETNQPAGIWGQHWTMNNCHPDSITQDGKRQIASFYYPLTGPYASGDSNLIDYQLLLMKYSGIDGVCIDWPGITQLYDYPLLVRNTERIISRIAKVGLKYSIVYEDQDIHIAQDKGVVKDPIAAAQNDMRYLQQNYFPDSNYERLNGVPLLLDFGPQTFLKPTEWTSIFSVLPTPPAFFTLWDHQQFAGKNASGAFAWINADHLVSLKGFYALKADSAFIASAYPGFNAFYYQGGWGGPTFSIPHDSLGTFEQTLSLALKSKASYVQLPTWNDYGEGTIIEPTMEFKYGYLTTLQKILGVPYGEASLRSVAKLYALRMRYKGNVEILHKLDQAFQEMAALHQEQADQLMNNL
jgi:hypothetical protein